MLKCKMISNIIVIIAFFIIITVPPILFIFLRSDIPIDTSENRELAKKPVFKLENIEEYPTNYEKYYNDNLPFRGMIRSIWTNFNIYVLNESTTSKVLVGKSEGDLSSTWLFFQDDSGSNPVKETQGIKIFSNEEMDEIANVMERNIKELENRDIQLYYTIIPNKENLYKEKLPDNIIIYEEETRVDKLINYIKNETELKNVIYLKDALTQAKETTQVYYKQDTHWNNYGAFIGFKEIVSKINDTYDNFEYNMKISEEKLIEQDLTKMSGIKDIFKDYEVDIEFLSDIKYEQTTIETENRIEITTYENAPIDKTLLIVGDSFRVAMIPYFSKIYSKVIYMHRCDYANYVLDAYQPDIIVCQFLERYVDTLKDFNLY